MKKFVRSVFLVLALSTLIAASLGFMQVFADDKEAGSHDTGDSGSAGRVGNGNWGVSGSYTGTMYTIVLDGEKYEYPLDAR